MYSLSFVSIVLIKNEKGTSTLVSRPDLEKWMGVGL